MYAAATQTPRAPGAIDPNREKSRDVAGQRRYFLDWLRIDILVESDGPATAARFFGVQFYPEDLLKSPRNSIHAASAIDCCACQPTQASHTVFGIGRAPDR